MPAAGLEPAWPCGREILSLMCLPFHHAGGAGYHSDPWRGEKGQAWIFRQDIAPFAPVSEQATVILGWHPFGNNQDVGWYHVVLFWFGSDVGCVSGHLCRDFRLSAQDLTGACGGVSGAWPDGRFPFPQRQNCGPDTRRMN